MTRTTRLRLSAAVLLLLGLQYGLRPRLGDPRFAPDFVLVALLLVALRVRPGAAAVAGFVVGLATDAVAPTAFGAAALAHTVTGYLAAWLKAFVVADSVAITALLVVAAAWLRDLVQVLAAHQLRGGGLLKQLFVYSPLAALLTGVAALVVFTALRGWLAERGGSGGGRGVARL